jgi:hypothetical protein
LWQFDGVEIIYYFINGMVVNHLQQIIVSWDVMACVQEFESAGSSETYQTTRCYIPKDSKLPSHRCDDVTSRTHHLHFPFPSFHVYQNLSILKKIVFYIWFYGSDRTSWCRVEKAKGMLQESSSVHQEGHMELGVNESGHIRCRVL